LLWGIATGQPLLLYSTLAALFLTNSQGPRIGATTVRLLFLACFIEPVAFALGTIVGITGLLLIPLSGAGIFAALMLALRKGWGQIATVTAINFAVGVGLLGGSVVAAEDRLVFAMFGALLAFTGIALRQLFLFRRSASKSSASVAGPSPSAVPQARMSWIQSDSFKHAVLVGVAAMVGHAIALVLGLPRDFWIVVTIIISLRPSLGETFTSTSLVIVGTAIGAVIAAAVTLTITNDYLLWVLLFAFAIAMFATRNMNFGLTQVFVTPFIIILLNILFPGQWLLAETRIVDVAIGGAISLLTVLLLRLRRPPHKAALSGPGALPATRKTPTTGGTVLSHD